MTEFRRVIDKALELLGRDPIPVHPDQMELKWDTTESLPPLANGSNGQPTSSPSGSTTTDTTPSE